METPPPRQHVLNQKHEEKQRCKYTEEEKKQLLANLDLEVKDRIRQFEAYLVHSLEAFKLRHENEVTRIPRAIRTLTMAEFADKYDGDVNKALQAITKARMEASGEPVGPDVSIKKRKWQPSTDDPQEAESSRAVKTARLASPQRKEAVGARPRLVKTPAARLRRAPPSLGSSTPVKASPSKLASPTKTHQRIPSVTSFNPALPKTPAFPRRPRANESLLSINGSPLANPYQSAYLTGEDTALIAGEEEETVGSGNQYPRLERQRSLAVLRGPSMTATTKGTQPQLTTSEVVLSVKVRGLDGTILEFDPIVTSPDDIEVLDGVSDDAKRRAKEELQELSSLMAKLGKWRI